MTNYLTKEEMIEVADTLIGAYEHVLSIYTTEVRDSAVRFTAELVMREIPYMLVTSEGAERLQQMVFGHEKNRDFVLLLTHVFFARQGGSDDWLDRLSATLARGLAFPKKLEVCLVPDELRQRLASSEDAVPFLRDNLWIITILLMQLFITPGTGEDAKS